MASREHTPIVRWTPRRINAALQCPKPTGEIARFHRSVSAPKPRSSTRAVFVERLAAFIARHADFLPVPSDDAFEYLWDLEGKPCGWLLVPATTWLVDALSELDAEHEDIEADADAEPDADREPDDEEADQADQERGDVRPESMDRGGLPDSGPDLAITPEQRRRYREGECISRAQEMRRLRVRLAAW